MNTPYLRVVGQGHEQSTILQSGFGCKVNRSGVSLTFQCLGTFGQAVSSGLDGSGGVVASSVLQYLEAQFMIVGDNLCSFQNVAKNIRKATASSVEISGIAFPDAWGGLEHVAGTVEEVVGDTVEATSKQKGLEAQVACLTRELRVLAFIV